MVAAVSGDRSAAAYGWAGIRRRVLAGERDWLLARLAEKPDLTLRALVAELVSAAFRRATGRCGGCLSRKGSRSKKSLFAAEQDRPDVAAARRWKKHQGRLIPRRLVFIDETWAKTNMTRTHGRCGAAGVWRQGTAWALADADLPRRDACDRFVAPSSSRADQRRKLSRLGRATTGPTLSAGDMVIMDNLGSHKRPADPPTIRAAGAKLSSCRPTRPTSTPSNRSSPSSRPCCEKPTSEPSKQPGGVSAPSRLFHPSRVRQLP